MASRLLPPHLGEMLGLLPPHPSFLADRGKDFFFSEREVDDAFLLVRR